MIISGIYIYIYTCNPRGMYNFGTYWEFRPFKSGYEFHTRVVFYVSWCLWWYSPGCPMITSQFILTSLISYFKLGNPTHRFHSMQHRHRCAQGRWQWCCRPKRCKWKLLIWGYSKWGYPQNIYGFNTKVDLMTWMIWRTASRTPPYGSYSNKFNLDPKCILYR